MTFKNIKFSDSFVMRSLERIAIKNGTFKQTELKNKHLIKEAVSSFSGDVFVDLIKLAKELRNRGYKKQAEKLEDKLFICKQAEAHLYRAIDEDGEDLINAAHPDGECHISDAQEGHGIVNTILTRHKKILDIVNKPVKNTSKQSKSESLVDDLIVATSYVLNVNLKKLAQSAAEDFYSGNADKKKEKLESVNKVISEKFKEIATQIKTGLADINDSAWHFDPTTLKTGMALKIYAEMTAIDINILNNYINKLHVIGAYNQDEINKKLYEKISSFDSGQNNGLMSYVESLVPGAAATYCMGSQDNFGKRRWLEDNPNQASNSWMVNNPNSVWTPNVAIGVLSDELSFNLDSAKVAVLIQVIQNNLNAEEVQLFGGKVLAKANADLAKKMGDFVAPARNALKFFSNPPILDENSNGASAIISSALNEAKEISSYSDKFGKSFEEFAKEIWANWSPEIIHQATNITSNIKSVIAELSKHELSSGDAIVKENSGDGFKLAGEIWYKAAQSVKDNNPAAFKKYFANQEQSFGMYKMIKDHEGKPYAELFEAVKQIFPGATTIEQLEAIGNNWLKMTQNFKFAASKVNVKTAQVAAPSMNQAGGIPNQETKPAPAANSNNNQGSRAVYSNDEKQAVRLMQDTLNSLSMSLESLNKFDRTELMKLRNNGQGPNTVSGDGIWGPRTKIAIETANKLLGLQMISVRNGSSATKDAQSNYNTLQQILKGMSGGKVLDNTLIDSLPQKIDWNGMPETATFDGGQIKLTSNDLSTLSNMYHFLTKTGLTKPTVSGASEMEIGQEGITLGEWGKILPWFRRRAVFKYNSLKDQNGLEEAKNTAKIYFQKVVELYNQYSSLAKSLNPALNGLTAEQINNYVIPGTYLQQIGAETGGAGGSLGGSSKGISGRKENGSGNSYIQYRKDQQGIGEGHGTKLNHDDGPPISENLNLASDWFYDLPHDNLSTTVLNLNQFIRTNAVDLAQTLFGISPPSSSDHAAAVRQGGYVVMTGQDGKQYVQDGGTKQWFLLDSVVNNQDFLNANPQIARNIETVRDRSPIDKFRQFLGQLSQIIHDVSNKWTNSSGAVQEDIIVSDEASRKWQQVIRRKLQQLQDWVKSK